MKLPVRFLVLCVGLTMAVQTAAYAHFKLLEPASWLVENDRGDPQKAGPCGGSNTDWGKPSYAITKAVGGQKLHVKIQETIYHPGHYRVALAVNSPTELPLDPQTTTRDTEKGPWSVSAAIQSPPTIPVLADGLFVHAVRPTGTDGSVRDRRAASEHQLQEVHASGGAVHGRARLQQPRRILLSPLRGAADYAGSRQTDGRGMAGGAVTTMEPQRASGSRRRTCNDKHEEHETGTNERPLCSSCPCRCGATSKEHGG